MGDTHTNDTSQQDDNLDLTRDLDDKQQEDLQRTISDSDLPE